MRHPSAALWDKMDPLPGFVFRFSGFPALRDTLFASIDTSQILLYPHALVNSPFILLWWCLVCHSHFTNYPLPPQYSHDHPHLCYFYFMWTDFFLSFSVCVSILDRALAAFIMHMKRTNLEEFSPWGMRSISCLFKKKELKWLGGKVDNYSKGHW